MLVAFIRGLVRHSVSTIGNFWVDLTGSILYILLPLSLVLALVLVSQGVLQNLRPINPSAARPATYEQPKLDAGGELVKDSRGNVIMRRLR